MNVTIHKPRAFRAALRIAKMAEDHLAFVKLGSDGALYATDGKIGLYSEAAHDAERTLYLSPPSRLNVTDTASGYRLDAEAGIITEERPRSEAEIECVVTEDERFPTVARLIPGRTWPIPNSVPHFDAHRASAAAKAYGKDPAVWVAGPGRDRVYLRGVDEGDILVLAAVKLEEHDTINP